MDTSPHPAVSDEEPADIPTGSPSRSLWMTPVAGIRGDAAVRPELVDLIAASLRAICQDPRDGDRAFWLMATILDMHLADSLSPVRTGRWAREAIDALMGMLSQPLQAELHRHLAEQGAVATG